MYTFNTLPSGNIDVLENGKSIYGAGTSGVSAAYASTLGYKAPAATMTPVAQLAPPAPTPPPAGTPAPAPSSWNLSSWTSNANGTWGAQPTLTINGVAKTFATPQGYIDALNSLKSSGATGSIDQYIGQFQNVLPAFASVQAPPAAGSNPAPASVNTYGLAPTDPKWLQLQSGETIANYNARIAAANPNLPAPGTTSPTGVVNNAVIAPAITTPTPVTLATDSLNTPSMLHTVGEAPTAPNYSATLAAIPTIDSITGTKSPEQIAAEGENATLQDRVLGVMSQMEGKSAAQTQAESDAGIPDLQKQLNDVNTQIKQLQNEAAAIPIQDQQDAEGRGITAAGLAPVDAAKIRNNTIQALGLSSIAAVLQGNLGLAQTQVAAKISAQFDPLQAELDYLKTALEMNSSNMDEADKEQAGVVAAKLQDRQNQIDAQKNDAATTMKYVLTAAQNGAPASVLSQAQNMSPADAVSLLQQYLPDTTTGGFSLSAGQTRYDANGNPIVTAPAKTTTTTTGVPSTGTITSGDIVITQGDLDQGKQALTASASQGAEADGKYADPNLYLQMYEHWVNSGGKGADFLKYYPFATYINPANTWLSQSISTFNASGSSSGAQTP